jgi:hypothetical protein
MIASLSVCTIRGAAFAAALLAFTATAPSALAVDLTGHWTGQWISCTSGHQGPLQADFCRIDGCRYRVTFRGRFCAIIPFRYEVTLRVVSDDGENVTLSGSSYLGRIYGTFTYRATATATRFVSRYDSCRDDGKFVLRRCGGCAPYAAP